MMPRNRVADYVLAVNETVECCPVHYAIGVLLVSICRSGVTSHVANAAVVG